MTAWMQCMVNLWRQKTITMELMELINKLNVQLLMEGMKRWRGNDEPGDGPGDGPDDKPGPVLGDGLDDDHGYSPYSPDQDVPFLCREDMSVCGYQCGQCDKASEVKCAVCDDMMCFSHVNGVAASEFWPESRVCKDCFLELTAHQIAHSLSRFSGSDVLPVSFAHLLRLL